MVDVHTIGHTKRAWRVIFDLLRVDGTDRVVDTPRIFDKSNSNKYYFAPITFSDITRPLNTAMRRLQLIEIHEQRWFPSSLRNGVTDALQFGLNLLNAYTPIAPMLQQELRSARSVSIVDLCSGAGGPWLDLSQMLEGDAQRCLRILLTDKYPNLASFRNSTCDSRTLIAICPDPVDAMSVPEVLKGFRTMFSSFHHFAPEEARAVLQNAVDSQEGIGIFEITRRAPWTVCLMFPWVFILFVCTPLIRPFHWTRLIWTYVIPIIPFVLLFDGIVSCLRTYRPGELRTIVGNLKPSSYEWKAGEYSTAPGKMPITYLIGIPRLTTSTAPPIEQP